MSYSSSSYLNHLPISMFEISQMASDHKLNLSEPTDSPTLKNINPEEDEKWTLVKDSSGRNKAKSPNPAIAGMDFTDSAGFENLSIKDGPKLIAVAPKTITASWLFGRCSKCQYDDEGKRVIPCTWLAQVVVDQDEGCLSDASPSGIADIHDGHWCCEQKELTCVNLRRTTSIEVAESVRRFLRSMNFARCDEPKEFTTAYTSYVTQVIDTSSNKTTYYVERGERNFFDRVNFGPNSAWNKLGGNGDLLASFLVICEGEHCPLLRYEVNVWG
jgi:hypothetical protein